MLNPGQHYRNPKLCLRRRTSLRDDQDPVMKATRLLPGLMQSSKVNRVMREDAPTVLGRVVELRLVIHPTLSFDGCVTQGESTSFEKWDKVNVDTFVQVNDW